MLDQSSIDLEEIANALAGQTDYEHHWLINPDAGEIAFWAADTGINGQTPVDLDELELVVIDPLPSKKSSTRSTRTCCQRGTRSGPLSRRVKRAPIQAERDRGG